MKKKIVERLQFLIASRDHQKTLMTEPVRMKTINVWIATLALLLCAPAVLAKEFRDCRQCPEMVAIPGKDYAIGRYLVTFHEWDACVAERGCDGYKPDDEKLGRGKTPVMNVSWDQAQSYLAWLSKKTHKTYRLPSEAEWEYACYGGKQTQYCGSDDLGAVAWFGGDKGNSAGHPHPVGEKQPNGYGLYDMTGDLWEHTADCWEKRCDAHVTRGGSWYDFPKDMVVTYRNRLGSKSFDNCIGFRVVRALR
jgi:formylglycine-generating enzyme required for sulfatase activity